MRQTGSACILVWSLTSGHMFHTTSVGHANGRHSQWAAGLGSTGAWVPPAAQGTTPLWPPCPGAGQHSAL